MGLLGSMIAGGVQGYANAVNKDIENQVGIDIARAKLEMIDEMNQRAEERKRRQNIADTKAINEIADARLGSQAMEGLGYAGLGADLTAEDMQTLRDNPAAVEAYRKSGAKGLLNSTRQQKEEARADAALSIGRTDIADKYEAAARGERQETKEDARHKETIKRIDQQIAQAENAEARADKRNADVNDRERLTALGKSIMEYRLMLNSINTQLITETDPDKIKELELTAQDLTDKINESTAIAANFGKTGKFDPLPEKIGSGKDFSYLFNP